MLVDSSVNWLVTELVGELSFRDIIHVMESHWIGAEVKWIVEILADTGPETLKPNENPAKSDLLGNPKSSPSHHRVTQ